MIVEHGGDTAGYTLHYGRPPLDFSASLNPLGMPEGVRRAAVNAVGEAEGYPDPHCRVLRAALGARLNLPPDWLLVGNGAADLIDRLFLAKRPRRALITAPTFGEYRRALEQVGCEVRAYPLLAENGFRLEEDFLAGIDQETDVVVLCQPNNPTGQSISGILLADILKRCEETDALLVLDECFLPFLEEARKLSLLSRIRETKSLFILGSFTKLYAMAGLRLGFGVCSDLALMKRISAAGQPWAVSSVAQAAGLEALDEEDYVNRSLMLIDRERRRMRDHLAAIGCEVVGSEANFVFFRLERPGLFRYLADRGILIRDCTNFEGLTSGYYRAAVRLPEDNNRLIDEIRRFQREE